jgi:hypothetical protein
VPGFPCLARSDAGLTGCAQVFAGLAGIAGRQLVVHAGDLFLGAGQVGERGGDLLTQRRGPFD